MIDYYRKNINYIINADILFILCIKKFIILLIIILLFFIGAEINLVLIQNKLI